MLIKINKSYESVKVIIDHSQNDYALYERDQITIFIYGYPVHFPQKKWLTPEDVMNYYLKAELDFINNIDGVYSIVIADKVLKKITVITDRVGIYTMFYYRDEDSLLISDRITVIKNERPDCKLNKESLLEFLNLGFKIGKKTFFEEISEFEPAQVYTIDSEFKLSFWKYWSVFDKKPEDKISKEEFARIFNNNLQVVTGLEDRILTPISGGKDTRMLLSSILNLKDKLHCYTFGPQGHTDITESKKICRHFNIKHDVIVLDDEWAKGLNFPHDLEELNINGIGPFFFNLQVKESMQREQGVASLALQGELGNQLWRHHPFGNNVPDSMNLEENALFMLRNLTRVLYFKTDLTGHYSNLYNDQKIEDIVGLLKTNIREDLSLLDNGTKPSDYSEFFILRTLAYNLYSNILKYIGRHIKLFLPNLQKDLLEQLHLLTINQRVRGEYNDFIIAYNNKFLSGLPYRNSGRVVKYVKMISNMITVKLFKTSFFSHPELHNYPRWIRKYHKEYFLKVLNYENMVLKDLFNKEELERLVNKFIHDDFSISNKNEILFKYSNQHFVYNLFSAEQWLQNHMDN